MAKKKSENVELGGASDILKLINKFDDNTEILENSTTSNTLEFISTGNYILNACLSGSMFKGIPSGRIISYCGENACLPKKEKIEIYIMKTKQKIHNIYDCRSNQ